MSTPQLPPDDGGNEPNSELLTFVSGKRGSSMSEGNPRRLYVFGLVVQICGAVGGVAVAVLTRDYLPLLAGIGLMIWGAVTMVLGVLLSWLREL